MKLLAVETSGSVGSLAISEDGVIVCEQILQTAGKRHAQTLASETRELFERFQWALKDLQAVAVSTGPGSFTGLRVGVVFAKTLAWANDTKLIAVDTLQAIAQRVPEVHERVLAISDAQRSELFFAEYRLQPETGIRVSDEAVRIIRPEELPQTGLITGPALQKFQPLIPSTLQIADASLWEGSAATVARIGYEHWLAEHFADPDLLEPLYLRRSYAEEKRPQ